MSESSTPRYALHDLTAEDVETLLVGLSHLPDRVLEPDEVPRFRALSASLQALLDTTP